MWIGEFGIAADAPNRDAWIADQVSLFRQHGLGYSWWEYHTTGTFSATTADFSWQPWIDALVALRPQTQMRRLPGPVVGRLRLARSSADGGDR